MATRSIFKKHLQQKLQKKDENDKKKTSQSVSLPNSGLRLNRVKVSLI
jgi:RPA family protein